MLGRHLLEILGQDMNLPNGFSRTRLQKLVESSGYTVETLTLEQLRIVAAEFLQETLLEVKQYSLEKSSDPSENVEDSTLIKMVNHS